MPADEGYIDKYGYQFVEGRVDPSNGFVTRWEKTESGIRRLDKVIPRSEWELVSGISKPDIKNGVNSAHEYIHNPVTKEVLAERKTYAAWRGWIDRWIGGLIDNSVGSCNGGSQLLSFSVVKIVIPRYQ